MVVMKLKEEGKKPNVYFFLMQFVCIFLKSKDLNSEEEKEGFGINIERRNSKNVRAQVVISSHWATR